MPLDRKKLFRSDIRRALGLLRVKVDASGTGLDENDVNRLISSACIWLSGRVTANFDPRDWSELQPRRLRQLEEAVRRFDLIAAAVNPRDQAIGAVRSLPATSKQQAEAEKYLWRIAQIIGEDIQSLVSSKRQEILETASRRGAYNVRVFGSVARGEGRPTSDVDFLVDLEPGAACSILAAYSWTCRTC